MAKNPSLFFAFEGIDGCGKSTQISLLEATLKKKGFDVLRIREPGGTNLSEEVRELLLKQRSEKLDDMAELLLFNAARAQLLNHVVRPAMEQGKVILADRFAWSTLAYQGYGRGMNVKTVKTILDVVVADLWPTKTFYLDLDVSKSRSRINENRNEVDRMESEKDDFFTRVLEGYREMALNDPQKISRYNATDSIDSLAERIADEVLSNLT